MILSIILFVLIILVIAILILFSIYVLLPSINLPEELTDDPVIPSKKATVLLYNKVVQKTDKKAVVLCSCNKNTTLKRSNFNEENSCFMVKSVFGTGIDCPFACLGLGDCIKVCPQEAIFIENNTAVISDNCCGCGKCAEICPQKIIQLVPKSQDSIVLCNNTSQHNLTSCSEVQKEKKINNPEKKDFKIFTKCYKIIKKFLYK